MIIDNKNFARGGQYDYATPAIAVLDFQNEGLLCVSGDTNRADSGYSDNFMDEI